VTSERPLKKGAASAPPVSPAPPAAAPRLPGNLDQAIFRIAALAFCSLSSLALLTDYMGTDLGAGHLADWAITGLAYCGILGNDTRRAYTLISDVAVTSARLAAVACDPKHAAIIYDRSTADDRERRLTAAGARHIVNRLRKELGAWSFRSPHVARHTTATSLLEVTGGDVRLVQEVLGHANLNTLQGYTKIVDSRKREAYRRYQDYLAEFARRGGACVFVGKLKKTAVQKKIGAIASETATVELFVKVERLRHRTHSLRGGSPHRALSRRRLKVVAGNDRIVSVLCRIRDSIPRLDPDRRDSDWFVQTLY